MILRRTKRTVKRFSAGLPWTEAETARLVKLYPKTSNKDLAARFGRPLWGVTGKARGLGLKKDYTGGYRRQSCMNPVPWSGDEEELLGILFPSVPNEEIAEILGRSLSAVHMKSRKLGLRKMEFWTETENELLKKLYKKLSYNQLAERLGRTESSIQIRVIVLGLKSKVEKWTEEEIALLKKSYAGTDSRVMAEELGRTRMAVAGKARRSGIRQNHHWPRSDIQKLKELYPMFTVRQVAEMMGCSFSSVRSKIRSLGLRKKAGVAKDKRNLVFRLVGDDYQRRSEHHLAAAGRFDERQLSNVAVEVM